MAMPNLRKMLDNRYSTSNVRRVVSAGQREPRDRPLRHRQSRRAAGRTAAAEDPRRGDRPVAPARPGQAAAVAFASGKPHSMILWGPPGVGKTTLARLMADAFNAEFIALSAVLSGVKDIREAVARAEATLAQSGRRTILFVDEVHRFNKAQQDAFLPYVEQGLGDLHRRDDRESVLRGESARCCRARRSMCWSRCPRTNWRTLLDRALAAAARRAVAFDRRRARRADRATPTATAAACSTCVEHLGDGRGRRPAQRRSTSPSSRRRSRAACAASTRAATRSTTRSPRCTSRCAAPIPTRRCTGCAACSTAAPIRSTSAGA